MDRAELDFDRAIDPTALDVEAVRQADVFFKWAERSVMARHALDRAKFDMEVQEARTQLGIRANPVKWNLGEKPTEAAIKAAAVVDPVYQTAYRDFLAAREESAMLDKAVEAMEQRKRMLEVLITLHGQQYFASPSAPRNLDAAWREHRKAEADRQTERQRGMARRPGEPSPARATPTAAGPTPGARRAV